MNDALELLPSRLCFVQDGCWAWFTTQAVESQWGPAWEMQPFDYDAGEPFEWMPNSNTVPYSLTIKISVQEINAKTMPWLQTGPWDASLEVWAGATITEFLDVIRSVGGKAFMEI